MIPDHLITILMLGGARRVSMAELLMQSGKHMGKAVRILSYELQAKVPRAAVADVIVGRKWSDPLVVDDLVEVCRREHVDIILPFVDGAIEIAARCSEKLPEVFVPASASDVAETMFDKIAAAKAFKEAEIPIPTTYSALTATMPAIAKPRHGSASRGIKVFYNMEDLMQLEGITEYLVQEYIEKSEEYTVDCYVDASGKILCTVPRLREEVMGGEVTRTRTCHLPEVEAMSRRVLEAFRLRGAVTLQFLHDLSKDRYLLMEVNPRLGGGVVCSIYAGAPITDFILKESQGMPLSPCDDWMPDTLMARYQKEVIFYGK